MSQYVSNAQVYAKIPLPKLVDALDDDGDGQIDPADPANPGGPNMLTQIMMNASNEVDGILAARVPTPFTGTIPPLVIQATLVFVCEEIYRHRPTGDKNPFIKEATELREKLQLIAQRKLPFDPLNEPETPGAQWASPAPLPLRIQEGFSTCPAP